MSTEHKPQILTTDNFSERVLESSRPALVDFWADWCAPCRAVAPVVGRVADQYGDQLTVGKVNVDEEPELARSYASAIWNVTYLACRTTFAPILISFSRSVVNDQCLTDLGSANLRKKFPRLYASANS